jgi:hypothetical protein
VHETIYSVKKLVMGISLWASFLFSAARSRRSPNFFDLSKCRLHSTQSLTLTLSISFLWSSSKSSAIVCCTRSPMSSSVSCYSSFWLIRSDTTCQITKARILTTDHEFIPAGNASLVPRAEAVFVTSQSENILPSKKKSTTPLKCLNCPMFAVRL